MVGRNDNRVALRNLINVSVLGIIASVAVRLYRRSVEARERVHLVRTLKRPLPKAAATSSSNALQPPGRTCPVRLTVPPRASMDLTLAWWLAVQAGPTLRRHLDLGEGLAGRHERCVPSRTVARPL